MLAESSHGSTVYIRRRGSDIFELLGSAMRPVITVNNNPLRVEVIFTRGLLTPDLKWSMDEIKDCTLRVSGNAVVVDFEHAEISKGARISAMESEDFQEVYAWIFKVYGNVSQRSKQNA